MATTSAWFLRRRYYSFDGFQSLQECMEPEKQASPWGSLTGTCATWDFCDYTNTVPGKVLWTDREASLESDHAKSGAFYLRVQSQREIPASTGTGATIGVDFAIFACPFRRTGKAHSRNQILCAGSNLHPDSAAKG